MQGQKGSQASEWLSPVWTIGSASKAQSIEFVENCSKLVELMGSTVQHFDEPFADFLGATDIMVHRIQMPNGSRILALPSNPRTIRDYPGNVVLDEFAHNV
jgi:phage FluMu gp28-like protein